MPINSIKQFDDIIKAEDKNKIPELDNSKDYFLGITGFNQATNFKTLLLTSPYKEIIKNGSVYHKTLFHLYEGIIGKNTRPKIIKSKYKIDEGDNYLYIKPLEEEELKSMLWHLEQKGLNAICKTLDINTQSKNRGYREREDIINELISLNNVFLKPILPINKEDIKKIENPLDFILNLLRYKTTQIDENLVYAYVSDIPEVDSSLIKPRDYMPYSDHKIIITNGGVGKTSLSYRITGETGFEKSSEAGLLGFSDAKNQKEGRLSNRTKHSYLEEIQEEKGEELFNKCHTLMEQGEMSIIRGLTINISSYSGLTFQGNPKTKEVELDNNLNDFLITKEFINFLDKISTNCEPFARRIGTILFDKNLKVIIGTGKENEDKIVQIIRTIAEGWKKEFTELFFNKNITNWLNSEFKEDYKKIIINYSNQAQDNRLKDFLKGQVNSYRHTKGTALRLAWLDKGLKSFWKTGEVNIKDLLESAEDHLERSLKRNIKSYSNIINLFNSEAYEEIIKYNVKNIKPEYVKLAVYTLFEWIIDNPENQDKIIPLIEIENNYSKVKDFLEIEHKHKYGSFYTIKEAFKKYKIDYSIIEEFGLDYDNQNQCFILIGSDKIKKYVELYKVTKVTKVTDKGTTQNNNKVTKVTKVTDKGTTQNNKVTKVTKVTKKDKNVTDVTRNPDFSKKCADFEVQEEKVLDIANLIKDHDKGEGVSFDTLHSLSGCQEEWLDKELKRLSNIGDLFQHKADKWKVL